MKLHLYIAIVLLAVLSSCQPHPTSPQPSLRGEGVACRALVGIDSLMWQLPDRALAVIIPLTLRKNHRKRPNFRLGLTEKVRKIFCNYYKNKYLCNEFLEKLSQIRNESCFNYD